MLRGLPTTLILWTLVSPLTALAAGTISVDATLSDTSVGLGDVVTLDIVAVATANGDVLIELPPLEGLSVLGRSESTQMAMSWTSAGQSIRREKRLRVELSADKPGRQRVPPIVARVGTDSAKTRPLEIMVEGSADPAPVSPPTAGGIVAPESNEASLFIRYRLSEGAVWLGQQVLLDLEIFADASLAFQVDSIPDPPDLDGFWREVLDRPKRLVPRTETIQGRRYQVFRAWRLAIYPLQSGTRTLEAVPITFRLGGGSLFSPGRRARRYTKPLALEVKALPTEGQPRGFSPSNVGNYALNASVDDRRIKAGKAVVLKLSLSGVGNIKSTRLPTLDSLDGFRVFPPTIDEDVTLRPNGVQGTKTAEILLVPNRGGQLTIPAFELPVFDPLASRYTTLKTQPISLEVVGTLPQKREPEPVSEPEAPKEPARERRPLRYQADLSRPGSKPWRSPAWWALLVAGPIVFGLTAGARAARARMKPNEARRVTEEHDQRSKRRLEDLAAAVERGDAGTAAAAFADAFYARASARLHVSLQGQTAEDVGEALKSHGASEDYARDIVHALETASYARFAPDALGMKLEDARVTWTKLVEQLDALGPRKT